MDKTDFKGNFTKRKIKGYHISWSVPELVFRVVHRRQCNIEKNRKYVYRSSLQSKKLSMEENLMTFGNYKYS